MNQQLTPEYGDVDALLRVSAKAFSYPRTPNVIAASVRIRLDDEAPSLAERLRAVLARPVLRAAAAVLLVAAVVVSSALLVPQSREALADFFGLSHVKIEIGPVLGPPPPVLSPDSFAEPATLAGARAALEFEIRLPVQDGVWLLPDAVYLQEVDQSAPIVILVYEKDGFDLSFRSTGFFGKGLPDPDLTRDSNVNGRPAIWIGSGGHIARSLDADGNLLIETERTVERGTLLWEDGGISYRLETGLSERDAILLAESLR